MRISEEVISQLKHVKGSKDEVEHVAIENCVGFTRVPLGIAGPLCVKGCAETDGLFYAPLATCEGTLIASCARGCKALNLSGGVQFKILHEAMSRDPVFWFTSTDEAVRFAALIPDLEQLFRDDAESTSGHLRLQRLVPQIVGSTVHMLFEYHCGDAAGQNMATFATQRACDNFRKSSLAKQLNLQNITIVGQSGSDKSLSWGNIMRSRGVRVLVWGAISDSACQDVLGCTTEHLSRVLLNGKEGAHRNGQLGYNVNMCNVIAAMFIACGQDAASVAEASANHLTVEFDSTTKELRLSCLFPSLPVGTVGGGTIYPTQREALELLQCTGPGSKHRLAGLIAAFSLALDVSSSAAVATGGFSRSHQTYGRRSKDNGKSKL
ncbi:hmg-CoA reductase [Xylogone sp. PMI_703]|nr:hmg-CoA reductase [Xylogone sp. PMI_703]